MPPPSPRHSFRSSHATPPPEGAKPSWQRQRGPPPPAPATQSAFSGQPLPPPQGRVFSPLGADRLGGGSPRSAIGTETAAAIPAAMSSAAAASSAGRLRPASSKRGGGVGEGGGAAGRDPVERRGFPTRGTAVAVDAVVFVPPSRRRDPLEILEHALLHDSLLAKG